MEYTFWDINVGLTKFHIDWNLDEEGFTLDRFRYRDYLGYLRGRQQEKITTYKGKRWDFLEVLEEVGFSPFYPVYETSFLTPYDVNDIDVSDRAMGKLGSVSLGLLRRACVNSVNFNGYDLHIRMCSPLPGVPNQFSQSHEQINIGGGYEKGLEILGIPKEDIERISGFIRAGQMPSDLIDVILSARKGKFYPTVYSPDKYPWHPLVHDQIFQGLEDSGLDTLGIWHSIKNHVTSHTDDEPPFNLASNPHDLFTNIFKRYALFRYHDLEKLERDYQRKYSRQ